MSIPRVFASPRAKVLYPKSETRERNERETVRCGVQRIKIGESFENRIWLPTDQGILPHYIRFFFFFSYLFLLQQPQCFSHKMYSFLLFIFSYNCFFDEYITIFSSNIIEFICQTNVCWK